MKGRMVFVIIAAAALIAAVGVSAFLIYTLALRTDYKETALQINEMMLENQSRALLRVGEKEAAADFRVMDYYSQFLQSTYTTVYSRKKGEPSDDEVIELVLGQYYLSFSKLEDGSASLIIWKTPEKEKTFCVRSQISFMGLKAYADNYLR